MFLFLCIQSDGVTRGFFLLFFGLTMYLGEKGHNRQDKMVSIPWNSGAFLVYICSQAGWIVAEVGRQPWTIQDLLPVSASASSVSSSAVLTTIILFFALFTALLELRSES